MDIQINNHTLLSEIRDAFHKEYPYLTIAFFRHSHDPGAPSPRREQLPYDLSVSDAGDPHRIGELYFTANATVLQLESEFEKEFGLHVQVLRKSLSNWLQITSKDNMTLKQLNEEAAKAPEDAVSEAESFDYQEQP